MNIAIVGSSKVTPSEETHVRQLILELIESHKPTETTIISGGAKGVDSIALDVAKRMGFKFKEYLPMRRTWESFKKRNLEIASNCDRLYCITVPVKRIKCYHHYAEAQNHEKTAGCWTMNKAKELGISSKLYVVGT